MPTIEFFGYQPEDRRALQQSLRAMLRSESFRDACVFVEAGSSRVIGWTGEDRPFVRVSTRSPERAERFKVLLGAVVDLEVVTIDFQEQGDGFEADLVEALQPIRSMVLAIVLHQLFSSGIYDELLDGSVEVRKLATSRGMEPRRLLAVLTYLENEEIVELGSEGGQVVLTARGAEFDRFRPWYELLVGGYADTFSQVFSTLGPGRYAGRNTSSVGAGSCGMSRYDAAPLLREVLTALPTPPTCIVDLGCGDGSVLRSLVAAFRGARGIAVDQSLPPTRTDEGPSDVVTFVERGAVEFVDDRKAFVDQDTAGTTYVAAFLLQEILEQRGRDAVRDLVATLVEDNSHLAVVEVDYRPDDSQIMRQGLGLAYYNPYYLVHTLTEQRLETEAFWRALFDEAGADVLAWNVVDPRVDSTGLEFGCLLGGRRP